MDTAARAAGIADTFDEPPSPSIQHTQETTRDHPNQDTDLESGAISPGGHSHRSQSNANRASQPRKSNATATGTDRVPIPISQRRSFSTTASRTRSRAGSTFTQQTTYTQGDESVPPTPTPNLPAFQPQPPPGEIGQALTTQQDPTTTTNNTNLEEDAEEQAGPPWDPLHPCWPHPNPHVPLSSPLTTSTRIIRLQRDYRSSGDLYPQFSTSFPEILEPFLGHEDFKAFILPLNTMLQGVFDPFRPRHWVDAIMGVVTGWAWEDLGGSGVKGGVMGVEKWVQRWNERVGRGRGVECVSLRRTGFLCVDLVVPDPRGWIVGEEGEERDEEQGAMEAYANGNGRAVNGYVNGGVGGGGYSHGPATETGYATTDAQTDGATEEGGSESGRTSGSFSRPREAGGAQRPRPDVPPIPGRYLGGDAQQL